MRASLLVAALAAVLLTATPASAGADDALEPVAQGMAGAGEAVADAAGAVGEGLGDAASGLGRGLANSLDAAAGGVSAAGRAILEGATAIASGLASAVSLATRSAVDAARLLGAGLAGTLSLAGIGFTAGLDGAVAAALAAAHSLSFALTSVVAGLGAATRGLGGMAGDALAWIAAMAAAGLSDVLAAISALRPKGMPGPVFIAIASTGAAASAAIAGWSLWDLARRLGFVGAAGFSRIAEDEVLDHPTRKALFSIVQENPGIHASELARRAGAAWGTLVHHLEKLERSRLLVVRKVDNQKCYFENGGKVQRQDMAVAGAMRKDKAALITGYVESHPMSTQKQVAEALGMSAALTSFHVRKLAGIGVLDVVRRGKETLLATSQALRRVSGHEETPVPLAQPALA